MDSQEGIAGARSETLSGISGLSAVLPAASSCASWYVAQLEGERCLGGERMAMVCEESGAGIRAHQTKTLMSSTRVAFVVHTKRIGGAEKNLLRILRAAPAANIEPAVVLCPREGPLCKEVRGLGAAVGLVEYHALRWRNPLRYARTIMTMGRWVVRTGAEIIHLNHQYLAEYAIRAGRLTGRPVVCHIRNLLGDSELASSLAWFRRADAIVGVAAAVLEPLRSAGVPEHKLHLIPNGIDSDALCSPADGGVLRRELRLPSSSRLVGVIGRVVPEKGIGEFLEAAELVAQRAPTIHFVIVGEDDRKGAFTEALSRTLARRGLEGRVSFTGFRRDIGAVLHDLDLVILPSRREMGEGLPNTVLETLAAGRLLVATRNSGVPEVVKDGVNGFLVDCDDTRGLARAIERALMLPERARREMSVNARLSVADRTVEAQVCRLAVLYRSLLEQRPGRSGAGC